MSTGAASFAIPCPKIHATLTDQRSLHCIRHLEPALLADFERMSEVFNTLSDEDVHSVMDEEGGDACCAAAVDKHLAAASSSSPSSSAGCGGGGSGGDGRSNFLNSNYVLFQLMRKHNYPCEFSSFYCLRTLQSRMQHDRICRRIFTKLGWPFFSTA